MAAVTGDSDLSSACRFAERAAREIGAWLREGFGTAAVVASKTERAHDVVTAFDTEADERIFDALSSFDPSIGFHGEERGASGSSSTFWLVDPIDGTGHFQRGMPFCTTMIALIHQGEVVVSVINDFVRNNTFSAVKGGGAKCDGSSITASDRSLRDAYIAYEIDISLPDNMVIMTRLQASTITLSTINSGWDFAMTAAGKLDGRVMKDPWGAIWDYAPGSLLVAEAGGRVANVGRSTYDYQDSSFLAVSARVFDDLTAGPDAIFPLD